jgi:hypothetical protein
LIEEQGCNLNTSDILKIGRIEYQVAETRICGEDGLKTFSREILPSENVKLEAVQSLISLVF